MNCPNCGYPVSQDYCQNCNRELIRINNRIFDKIIFNEARNVHERIDNFIDNAIKTERIINENIDNPDFYPKMNTPTSLGRG